MPKSSTEVAEDLRRLAPQVLGAVVRRYGHFETAEDAARMGMSGSPTILIDGREPFGGGEPSLSCRRYRTSEGLAGSPTVDQLVEALS